MLTRGTVGWQKGHDVVGSVRKDIYGDQLLSLHPEWKGKVTFINVSDYTKEGTWDEAFKPGDLDYVLHVAAPMPSSANKDFDRDFLEPNVKGYALCSLFSPRSLAGNSRGVVGSTHYCSIARGHFSACLSIPSPRTYTSRQ
jgi:hypothetical protein